MPRSVSTTWYKCVVSALLTAATAFAAAPIPPANRIAAEIVATRTAPAADPVHMPTDVAVDSRGVIYLADGTNDRIVRFRPDGSFDASITAATVDGLHNPVGLFVDTRDHLWIAGSGARHVLALTPDGRVERRIELPSLDAQHPFDATDVLITPDGERIYIVDNDNHRIVVRDQGAAFRVLGGFGRAAGQLQWPFQIALAPDGDVYITEAIGARVQRLGPRNLWAGQVGTWGIELGQLYRPKGVVCDARGRIYVSDSTLNVVQVFNARGEMLGVLTNAAGEPLRFRHPMGLAFDPQGRLLVVELAADRVAIVRLPDGWIPATQPTTGGAP